MQQHGSNQTELSFEDVTKQDPLMFTTFMIFALLLMFSFHIWINSQKDLCAHRPKSSTTPNMDLNVINKLGFFQETKNIIIGAGGTLVAITTIVLFLIPSFMAKVYLMQNPDGINFGSGRAWAYIGRIAVPSLSFVILPSVIIINNPKMRTVLKRKLKDLLLQFKKTNLT